MLALSGLCHSAWEGVAQEASAFQARIDTVEAGPQPDGLGTGFAKGTTSLSFELGASVGLRVFGGEQEHDLALGTLAFGCYPFPTAGKGRWWRGNWEIKGEMFSGGQWSPEPDWLGGFNGHVRYNFATGTPLVPFIGIGGGLMATSIGPPDLGGNFQFNEQAVVGFHYFLKEDLAITVDCRGVHISSAGIYQPNQGVNTIFGFIGLTWLF